LKISLKFSLILLLFLFFAAFMFAANGQIPAELLLNTKVDAVEVHDAPIEDVLRLLAEQIDLNLLIGPDSMGTISLRFAGVTLREALDAMLQSKGFQYQLYGNILMVSRPDSIERARGLGLETQLFKLKYADATDIKATIDTSKVLSPWGYTTISFRTIKTDAVKVDYLKPSVSQASRELYKLEDPIAVGKKPLQARSDILIVTDKPPVLKRVAELIAVLDQPHKQVEIEVHFVETILGDNRRIGIDWSALLSAEGSYQGKTKWLFGEKTLSEVLGTGTNNGAATVADEVSKNTVEFGSLSASRFNTVLDLMVRNESAKLLSQPHITTLDNQPASISVGVTTWIEERTSGGTSGETRITYHERQVPIELVVVPHILHKNRVLLELRPRVEEITGWQDAEGGYQLPLISTRTSDSRVEVADNETAVIGGLIKEKKIKTEKRVWLLGSLPLIGHLFRHMEDEVERTDLSIFITPHIIDADSQRDGTIPSFDDEDTGEIPSENDGTGHAEKNRQKQDDVFVMNDYFPLTLGSGLNYNWQEVEGEQWQSRFKVVIGIDDVTKIEENIPDGAYKSVAFSGYKWADQGMLNLYRDYVGGDSVSYESARVILPARMKKYKTYVNSFKYRKWDKNRQLKSSGETVQQQRLIGKFTVSTEAGKFKDCLAVETISFPPGAEEIEKTRKIVWYAEGVGPVKVENDIPLDDNVLRGGMSALLANR
jgi:type IV pilus secretin PilQ/predicted competence protein